jgi:hypothetical protein
MQTTPNDPPPQEDPTHDVPVYPEGDPPPSPETGMQASNGAPPPGEGEDDVDEDDLDPQSPHSPPDVKQDPVVFDENKVPA